MADVHQIIVEKKHIDVIPIVKSISIESVKEIEKNNKYSHLKLNSARKFLIDVILSLVSKLLFFFYLQIRKK